MKATMKAALLVGLVVVEFSHCALRSLPALSLIARDLNGDGQRSEVAYMMGRIYEASAAGVAAASLLSETYKKYATHDKPDMNMMKAMFAAQDLGAQLIAAFKNNPYSKELGSFRKIAVDTENICVPYFDLSQDIVVDALIEEQLLQKTGKSKSCDVAFFDGAMAETAVAVARLAGGEVGANNPLLHKALQRRIDYESSSKEGGSTRSVVKTKRLTTMIDRQQLPVQRFTMMGSSRRQIVA